MTLTLERAQSLAGFLRKHDLDAWPSHYDDKLREKPCTVEIIGPGPVDVLMLTELVQAWRRGTQWPAVVARRKLLGG